MKINNYCTYSVLTFLMCILYGCEKSNEYTDLKDKVNSDKLSSIRMAELPTNLLTTDDLGTAISVLEARKQNEVTKKLIIEGFIGGRKEPFASNRASFILGDHSIQTCDKIPGDYCPTPWDACCEDRKKILEGTLSVQLLDQNSSLIKGNLNGVGQLRPGLKIKIAGTVDSKSLPNSMLFNALQIQAL